MIKMIDIHSHLLGNVDDGARDIEEALIMASLYVKHGFSQVITTPHWIQHSQGNLEVQEKAYKLLEEKLYVREIPLTIHRGNELYVDVDIKNILDEKKAYLLADSSYILVEFPMQNKPNYLDKVLYDLQLGGYNPIIAHPERYSYVVDDPNLVSHWIKKGALIQMNIPSLLGMYGRKVKEASQILLDHSMVHFLATDSHSQGRRSPAMLEGISSRLKEKEIDLYLRENPRKIIENRDIKIEIPEEYKKRKWFFF